MAAWQLPRQIFTDFLRIFGLRSDGFDRAVIIREQPMTIGEHLMTIREQLMTIREQSVTIGEQPVTVRERTMTIRERFLLFTGENDCVMLILPER